MAHDLEQESLLRDSQMNRQVKALEAAAALAATLDRAACHDLTVLLSDLIAGTSGSI